MSDVSALMDRARTLGFSLHLVDGKVKIIGQQQPDQDAHAVIAELRLHRNEVAAMLRDRDDDPILPVDAWYPKFHQLHRATVAEVNDFDYAKCRTDQSELYRQIKDIEIAIDRMDQVRLSEVVTAMSAWRELVLKACLEQREVQTKKVAGE